MDIYFWKCPIYSKAKNEIGRVSQWSDRDGIAPVFLCAVGHLSYSWCCSDELERSGIVWD